jgi:hypothetical protein
MNTTILKSNKVISVPTEHLDAVDAILNYNLNTDLYNKYLVSKGIIKPQITVRHEN